MDTDTHHHCNGAARITGYKEAAAKSFTFYRYKWVSFADKDTLKGGVMTWTLGHNDKKFSALKGLLGINFQDCSSLTERAEKTDTGKWASLNGQNCVITDYGNPPKCPSSYDMASNSGGF
uniref:Uncharacterized protein n=1 Tax=Bionectria ochroleuca TaxID=29856 RepID=A0A8H7N176_BIOOC